MSVHFLQADDRAAERRARTFERWLASVPRWHDHFVFTPNERVHWTPLGKPLSDCRVALVSTAGVHLRTDPPFDTVSEFGDPSYRVIPARSDPEEIVIADTHYDHHDADQDIICLFPLSRLTELAADGVIGTIGPQHFGFMGFVPDPQPALRKNARQVATTLIADEVDVVFLTPG